MTNNATITDPAPEATVSHWSRAPLRSCPNGYISTDYNLENNTVVNQWHPCRTLSCEFCGVKKREADLKIALEDFALYADIYVVEVDAERVDPLRKRAGRRGFPIKTVPISETRNIVFSPYQFESCHMTHWEQARKTNDAEIRDIFLERRVSKRHVRHGEWGNKRAKPTKTETKTVNLARDYISPKTFEIVGVELGYTVMKRGSEAMFFFDTKDIGPERLKRLLIAKEGRRRSDSRRERGIGWSKHASLAA